MGVAKEKMRTDHTLCQSNAVALHFANTSMHD
jgi:hypothetical protein